LKISTGNISIAGGTRETPLMKEGKKGVRLDY
jgi:hypothetical protein